MMNANLEKKHLQATSALKCYKPSYVNIFKKCLILLLMNFTYSNIRAQFWTHTYGQPVVADSATALIRANCGEVLVLGNEAFMHPEVFVVNFDGELKANIKIQVSFLGNNFNAVLNDVVEIPERRPGPNSTSGFAGGYAAVGKMDNGQGTPLVIIFNKDLTVYNAQRIFIPGDAELMRVKLGEDPYVHIEMVGQVDYFSQGNDHRPLHILTDVDFTSLQGEIYKLDFTSGNPRRKVRSFDFLRRGDIIGSKVIIVGEVVYDNSGNLQASPFVLDDNIVQQFSVFPNLFHSPSGFQFLNGAFIKRIYFEGIRSKVVGAYYNDNTGNYDAFFGEYDFSTHAFVNLFTMDYLHQNNDDFFMDILKRNESGQDYYYLTGYTSNGVIGNKDTWIVKVNASNLVVDIAFYGDGAGNERGISSIMVDNISKAANGFITLSTSDFNPANDENIMLTKSYFNFVSACNYASLPFDFNNHSTTSQHHSIEKDQHFTPNPVQYTLTSVQEFPYCYDACVQGGQNRVINPSLPPKALEANIKEEFYIYPNPAGDLLQFHYNSGLEKQNRYRLINMNGKVIRESNFSVTGENVMIKIDDLPSGVYILEINGSKRQKFVKQ